MPRNSTHDTPHDTPQDTRAARAQRRSRSSGERPRSCPTCLRQNRLGIPERGLCLRWIVKSVLENVSTCAFHNTQKVVLQSARSSFTLKKKPIRNLQKDATSRECRESHSRALETLSRLARFLKKPFNSLRLGETGVCRLCDDLCVLGKAKGQVG